MAGQGFSAQLSRLVGRALGAGVKAAARELERRSSSPSKARAPSPPRQPAPRQPAARDSATRQPAPGGGGYPGDFSGVAKLEYAPRNDGRPDPGEVVWAWVPFEEDYSQGKDRPVLVIARDGGLLLALMLTSKDHDRDHDQEARAGRHWLEVGTGAWDREGRPSEVRLDRILQLEPGAVRREGAVLDRATYDQVAASVRRVRGW